MTLSYTGAASGQTKIIWEGWVLDSLTGDGLPFAAVKALPSFAGTMTDVDGRFRLVLEQPADSIEVSFLGFQTRRVALHPDSLAAISMRPLLPETETVTVVAGENPALVLIRKLIANRNKHHPRKYDAFNYRSYTKITLVPNPKYDFGKEMDSVMRLMKLMVWETTTLRSYIRPYRDYEKVIGSRFSGLPGTPLPMSPTEVQDISFYTDWVRIFEQEYLSPIAFAAPKRYRYLLSDTLLDGKDTVYSILFFPNKNFGQGMSGELRVNATDYAIVSVSAEMQVPDDVGLWSKFRIQQKHAKINGERWFPVQLFTEAHALADKLKGDQERSFVIEARSTIDSISFEQRPKEAPSNITLDLDERAAKQDEDFWRQSRGDTLSSREQTTYQKLDSIGRKYKLGLLVRQVNKLMKGYIAVGPLDFELSRIVRFNRVEDARLGLGFLTNEQLSNWFSVGGWAGYGTGDNRWKYGADLQLHPLKNQGFRLHYDFDEDLTVTGSDYLGMKSRRQLYDRPSQYRSSRLLFMEIMDYRTTHSVSLFFPSFTNVSHRLSVQHDNVRPAYAYSNAGRTEFVFTDVIAELRWAPSERFRREGRQMISLGTQYPVLLARGTQGLAGNLGGQYSYQKLEASLSQYIRLRSWLDVQYEFNAGILEGDLHYPRLYIFHANGEPNFIAEGNAFNTMFFNDFVGTRYFTGHLNFHLINQGFPTRKYNPDARLVLNYGVGELGNLSITEVSEVAHKLAPNLGYWETGFAFINLIPRPLLKLSPGLQFLGFGLYCRFGPYSLPDFSSNLAPKIEYRIKF